MSSSNDCQKEEPKVEAPPVITPQILLKKNAFRMKLKPGVVDEYKRRHDEIWPELVELLHNAGVSDYHIFFDERDNSLFAVHSQAGDQGSQDLGTTEVVKKWWAYMADLMEVNEDNSPVSTGLTEVFHMK